MSTKNASIRYVTVVAALLCALAAVGTVLPACGGGSSSGGGGGSPGADSGHADSTAATDSGGPGADSAMGPDSASAGDSTTAGDAGSDSAAVTDSDAVDSNDAGLAADAAGVVATIPLSGQPTALAIDNTRNRLYVAVANAQGTNGGLAIIDTTTDTVTATIPAPVFDSGTLYPFFALALDPTANLLYACDLNATPLVYVFDLTADTFKNRFSIVGTGVTAPWINALAVNPETSTLYVGAFDSSGGASKVAVIDTTNDTLTTEVTLSDLAAGFNVSSLGLDTTNNLLFACANGPGNGTPATAVDAIDTTTNLETGTQQQLVGSDMGCQGGPGFAVDVTVDRTVTDGGVAGYVNALEPRTVALPRGFVPDGYTISHGGGRVVVLGHTASGFLSGVAVNFPQGEDASVGPTVYAPDFIDSGVPYNSRTVRVGVKGPTEFYLTLDLFSDAGTSPENAVYDLHIPALGNDSGL